MFLTDLSIKRPVVASVMSLGVSNFLVLLLSKRYPLMNCRMSNHLLLQFKLKQRGASAEIVDTQITQKIEDFG